MRYTSTPPGYLTTELAAKAAGVKPDTIRDWKRRGILHRSAGSPRYPLYTVDAVDAAKAAAKPTRAGQRAHR
ncbi:MULTISPECIES: MerR family transcriptional regulator [Streptomyces]|uniref:MerR family transcriptional regulator n=1 Tax=Streptomyces coerulescens TaxID=29304 RepID=A0ABW0CND4_STRCD